MSQLLPLQSVVDATSAFVAGVRDRVLCRLEAKVSSHEGMPLLCAVEAVLAQTLSRPATQELVWLSGAPRSGAHVLRLQAFGPGNELLAEAIHEFSTGAPS